MIKVVFKEKYGKYGETEYTYLDKNVIVEVGDEVVVDTRYGYALAKVTKIDVEDNRFKEEDLKEVKMIVETALERENKIKKEQERKENLARIAANARKKKLLNELQTIVNAEDYEKYVADMTLKELEELYGELTKINTCTYKI